MPPWWWIVWAWCSGGEVLGWASHQDWGLLKRVHSVCLSPQTIWGWPVWCNSMLTCQYEVRLLDCHPSDWRCLHHNWWCPVGCVQPSPKEEDSSDVQWWLVQQSHTLFHSECTEEWLVLWLELLPLSSQVARGVHLDWQEIVQVRNMYGVTGAAWVNLESELLERQ